MWSVIKRNIIQLRNRVLEGAHNSYLCNRSGLMNVLLGVAVRGRRLSVTAHIVCLKIRCAAYKATKYSHFDTELRKRFSFSSE